MKIHPLYFENIHLRRARSLPAPGFAAERLLPGVNIIYGPNASGKTTLAAAIQTLLWPKAPLLKEADLIGSLRLLHEPWRVEIQNNQAHHQRRGVPVNEGLSLPPTSLQDRYYFGLKDLLVSHHRPLAQLIIEESVGGYDIMGAAENLGFRTIIPRSGKATRAAREAQGAYKKALSTQKSLLHIEARAQELAIRLKELTSLEERRPLLERALACRLVEDELNKTRHRLASFPSAMAKLRGHELKTLEDLRKKRAANEETLQEALAHLEEAQNTLHKYRALQGELPPAFLQTQQTRAQKLAHLEDTLARHERELASIKARHDDAWTLISDGGEPTPSTLITSHIIGRLERLADEADELRGASKVLHSLENLIPRTAAADDEGKYLEAINLLRAWLRSPAPPRLDPKLQKNHQIARALSLLSALLFASLALTLSILYSPLWAALILTTIPLVWSALTGSRSTPPETPTDRSFYRREYEKLSLPGPQSWTEDALSAHLRSLEETLASERLAKKQREFLESKKPEYAALQERIEQLQTHHRRLTAELGLRPQESFERSPARLYWYLNHLHSWQKSARDLAAADAELQTTKAQLQEARQALNDALRPLGFPEITDAAQARAQLRTLEEDLRLLQAAREKYQRATEQKTQAQTQLEDANAQIDALFQSLNLNIDDDLSLKNLLDQLPDYQKITQEISDQDATLRYEQAHLQDLPSFDDEISNLDSPTLNEKLQHLQEALSQREALLKEHQDLKTRIGEAKKSHEVEQKRALYEKSLQDLQAHRLTTIKGALGAELARYLHEETRHSERPPVFHRANQLFSAITKGRYELLIDDGEAPAFRALDTHQNIGQSLDQLSSGTRVQLLLSVRLAFVEEQEDQIKLPLILDEILANSDDHRAQAIMEAIIHISAQGRQIFYLTAQQDEVEKWRALQDSSPIPLRFIELPPTKAAQGLTKSTV